MTENNALELMCWNCGDPFLAQFLGPKPKTEDLPRYCPWCEDYNDDDYDEDDE